MNFASVETFVIAVISRLGGNVFTSGMEVLEVSVVLNVDVMDVGSIVGVVLVVE